MKKAKHILTTIIFIILFVISFIKVSDCLRHKGWNHNATATFFQLPAGQIDVVLVGTSHVYMGLYPMDMWDEAGITSYNIATPSQGLPSSYYLIKEAIHRQHPKVIVLDTYGIKHDNGYFSVERLHMATDSIPFGPVKLELYRDLLPKLLPEQQWSEFYFPIIRYHERWKELKKRDFVNYKTFMRGSVLDYEIFPCEETPDITACGEISDINRDYLEKIAALCEAEGVQLVICQIPFPMDENYIPIREKANTMLTYAVTNHIPTLDMEQIKKELQLDYQKDFKDDNHLNSTGGEKVSRYFANWLVKQCNLQDHRGDDAFAQWEEDWQLYVKEKEQQKEKES